MTSSDTSRIRSWADHMRADPYRSYLYAYPHKTAYRELEPSRPLSELWAQETAETYFLYMHIPFCGARCGFCNLFTLPDKRTSSHEQYVDALERQAREWDSFAGGKPFARFAIGGGTPTLLEPQQLERLFGIAEEVMGLDTRQASISVETSPETVTEARLRILHAHHVDRVSMGIQSFIEDESAAIYRPQKPLEVERALTLLKSEPFPILNLDLIYGLPGQTVATWLYSVERTLAYEPEEVFIYPLYTREQTIVKPEDIRRVGADLRMDCYLAARDRLREAGYIQHSMRRFAKPTVSSAKQLLPYGCQEDGMVGLGCGARSYTRELHYASRYAVDRQATASIIADYVAAERHDRADYGYQLNKAEQQRRFILKAILHTEGLELSSYVERFASQALEDYPDLHPLLENGFATKTEGILRLTDEGLAYSDAIGDWFISPEVKERMEGYVFV
ncbi:coproporphyrinogen III oxidase [Paenibacillus marchantiophytorum]|uniref:Heme chaperone HemW n=1 Tax=Paenibacillus marchantiophytorum TaxID=1619310 RepID=A0ABQ2BQI8_9BACL|nr:STM4012 family radical SAM protein [Paenibacillus marchantiophytorum]GGI45231.1 coproporphyrinogen III oxidase [Paenibacillus marchantiophytorum]